ncbi:Exonuclease [Phytophthora infestans]|uniref:Exonuclease n=1 Tax=Phytophthora infestans TaxID=4787 RepID=A0A8S9U3L0_PHYIN|nr:Exonuclease [Phytophthora infestans]
MASGVMRGVLKRKLQIEQEGAAVTKKQRVYKDTVTAVDVMNKLLSPDGDVGYDVTEDEWEQLVQLTQKSERFEKLFTFPEDEPGWVTTKSKKKKTHLNIVAVDCEMCVTQDESNCERKTNALCRVSAVDGEHMLRNIISDFIVHQPEPGFHMVDPKTDIHGITPQQIASCKITVAQAQKKMLKYINKDTIVVGHSVYGDLASMRINHRRVIDTALIFQRKDGSPSRATPGLKDLTKFLLGFDMPQGHDSTVDAQASMMAAKYAARHETGRIIPSALELHGPRVKETRGEVARTMERTEYTGPAVLVATAYQPGEPGKPVPVKIPVNDASYIDMAAIETTARKHKSEAMIARSCRLRLHRIPKGLSSKDIEKWFYENTHIVPTAVEKIVWLPNQNRGSCNVTFSTNAHAALAFESAQGPNGKTKITNDSIGRPQKTIAIVSYMGKTYKNVALGVL